MMINNKFTHIKLIEIHCLLIAEPNFGRPHGLYDTQKNGKRKLGGRQTS